jgi:hypothetical protein
MADSKRIEKLLDDNKIVLFIVSIKKYPSFALSMIKHLNKKGWAGIYVGVVKPYADVAALFKKNGIDVEKIYFIDCISKSVAFDKMVETARVSYLMPGDLTGLGIAVDEGINHLTQESDKVFVFVDTLSTLLIYSSAQTLAKFSHFLTGRLRLKNLRGVILTLEKEAEKSFLASISSFCDAVIEVN